MGAVDFREIRFGKDAKEAFNDAVDHAQYMHGHGGYTGTIAEKRGFRLFERPKGSPVDTARIERLLTRAPPVGGYYASDEDEFEQFVRDEVPGAWQQKFRSMAKLWDDKWGPAVAIPLSPSEEKDYRERHGLKGKRGSVFVFCGMASH